MIIYYCMTVVILLYGALIYGARTRPSALALSGLPFFTILLVVGLRSTEVGTDTSTYVLEYQNSDSRYRFSEFGFSYFLSLLKMSGANVTGFLLTVSLITSGSIAWLIHNYSKNIILSYLLYINLGFMSFAMSGLRQALAISITSVALIFLIRRQRILFCFLVILATTFHNSAIIFLLALPFSSFVLSREQAIGIFLIALTVPFLFANLPFLLVDLLGLAYIDEYLINAKRSNQLLILIAFLTPLTALIFWPKGNERETHSILFLLTTLAMTIAIFARDFVMLGRIGLYFNVYMIILLPNIIERIRPTSLRWVSRACLVFVAICFFAITTPNNSIGIDDYTFSF